MVWIKQQKLISHSSGGRKSKIKVPTCSVLSRVCRPQCSCCVLTGGESWVEPGLLSLIPSCGLHLQDRITSQRPRLEIAPHWRLRRQPVDFGGDADAQSRALSVPSYPSSVAGDKQEPRVPSVVLRSGRAPAPAPHTPSHGFAAPGAPEREPMLPGHEVLSHSLSPGVFILWLVWSQFRPCMYPSGWAAWRLCPGASRPPPLE